MTITTADQMTDALLNNSSVQVVDKASLSNSVAGQFFSKWRATGIPGQGAIPTTAALCTKALAGSFAFTDQTAPATSYAAYMALASSNNTITIELHDRIAHMGGLNGTLLTAQTVGVNLHSSGLNAPANRIGPANFSAIQWWADWYTDTGATAANATFAVTYGDGTTGNLTAVAVGGTVRASRMIGLNPLIPSAQQGKYIRSVDSVTLSASTGTAGNFGVTATRRRAVVPVVVANVAAKEDFISLSPGSHANEACFMFVVIPNNTSTGTLRGAVKIAHG